MYQATQLKPIVITKDDVEKYRKTHTLREFMTGIRALALDFSISVTEASEIYFHYFDVVMDQKQNQKEKEQT